MILIFGAGISGMGALNLLKSKGKDVLLIDDKISDLKTEDGLKLLETEEIEYIVKSPGIPFETKLIQEAIKKGINIVSEIDIAYEYMNKNIEIIAFTGTNGKTTTCTKTYELFKKAGFNVALGGNVGKSFAEIVLENKELDYIILELSSYQLENNPKIKPKIAGIINLSPDHLSRYKNEEDYYLTKFNIFNNLTAKDKVIVNIDDNEFLHLSNIAKEKNENYTLPKRLFVSKQQKGNVFVFEEKVYTMKDIYEMYTPMKDYKAEFLIDVKDIALKGEHNLENLLFVISAALICGIPKKVIVNFLKETKSLEHRMEDFYKISNSTFINDSKGTNVDSTTKAINSYNNKIILICGGQDKKVSLTPLAKIIQDKVNKVYLFGENRFLIENELKNLSYTNYEIFDNVKECIEKIKNSENLNEDSTYLFSPATASFDQFKNFEERGKYFKNIVLEVFDKENV